MTCLRRRTHLMRKRAELLAHVQNTNSQYNLPEIGKKIAYKANREGVAERFDDAAVQKTIEVDLALITYYDELLRTSNSLSSKPPSTTMPIPSTCCKPCPALAKSSASCCSMKSMTSTAFPRVQDFASYCRLVKCSKESGGKRLGTSGKKIGNAHLKWAFSEAAALFLRNNPQGQKLLARLEKKHDKGKALSILAHKLARAVYYMLKRKTAFDMDLFLQYLREQSG